jgi:hypothetical protein
MLPLYEAKMIHLFDHRFGTYEGQTEAQANQGKLPELDDAAHADVRRAALPRYWVTQTEVEARLGGIGDRGWLLGWRDIVRSHDKRTVIACVVPRVGVGHTMPLMFAAVDPRVVGCLCANLASFSFDYVARQKVGGIHLTYGLLKQLPVLSPFTYLEPCPWDPDQALRDWILPRVLELIYTAWDLQCFAEDVGDDSVPYIWDPERRFQLQCEIDAAFFHLYDVSPGDVGYILDTFNVLRDREEGSYREYRTKRVILEIYDALAAAAASSKPYVSPLGPPRRGQ